MIRKCLRLLSWAATALVALLLVCNLYTIGARLIGGVEHPTIFGWSWAVVISGSMEDTIQVDDLVVIHRQESYRTGDIITFHSGNTVVTHRIIGEDATGFITKGDANNAPDIQPVKPSHVIGKVVWVIGGVGTLIGYLRTPLGMLCLAMAGFAMVEIPYLLDRRAKDRGRNA